MRIVVLLSVILLFLISPATSSRLLFDQFLDGNYTGYPEWVVTDGSLTVENEILHSGVGLNAAYTTIDTSMVIHPTEYILSYYGNTTTTGTIWGSSKISMGDYDTEYGAHRISVWVGGWSYPYINIYSENETYYDINSNNISSYINDGLMHKYELRYDTETKNVTFYIDNSIIPELNFTDSGNTLYINSVWISTTSSVYQPNEYNFDNISLLEGWACTESVCDTYAAKNGSDAVTDIPPPGNFTVTNAAYIDEGNTDVNYGTADNLTFSYDDTIYINKSILIDLGANASNHDSVLYVYQRSGVGSTLAAVYSCAAFDEDTVTWATQPECAFISNYLLPSNDADIWIPFSISSGNRYLLINATAGMDAYVWESDDSAGLEPYVEFASSGTEQNDCLSWSSACLNISRAESLIDAYGTVHIGYGNYTYQPAMNGALGIPVEYACDEAGYQENVSEPWCDMPGVNSS